MTKMKNSGIEWIGDIPVGWEISTLKYLATIKTGGTPSRKKDKNFADNGTLWVKPDNLNMFKSIDKTKEYLTEDGILGSVIAKKHSVLVCCIGSIGKIGYSELDVTYNQQINAVNFNNRIYWKFGLYSLFANEEQHWYYSNGNVIKILNNKGQGNIRLIFPSLKEQQAIADFLDEKCLKIDSLLTNIKTQIEVLEEYKKSIITETVTKGLNKNVQMKDSGIEWIGEVPKDWHIKKIKYIYKFHTGFTPDTSKSDFYCDSGDGYNWITISDLNNDYVIPQKTKSQISLNYVDLYNPLITSKDSLLYTFKLSVGQVAFTTYDVYTNEAIASFVKNENLNLNFLYYSSFLIEYYANENIYGAKILNQTLINNSFTIFPPIQEQQEIATYLDEKCSHIDGTITSKLEQITTLEEYKKSIIFEYITGKKEVN